jgi:hypothetical protein
LAIVGAVTWATDRVMPEDAVKVLQGSGMGLGLLISTLAIYAVFIAIPFVPGVEIGATLLLLGGAAVAPFVYVATVLGLSLAFLAGRFVSYDWLHRLFADFRLAKMCRLLDEMKPLKRDDRLKILQQNLPNWAKPVAIQGRYVLLALLLVLPGNAVFGGGGGICLMAGVTRLFSTAGALLAIALAVLPIPLAVWAIGLDVGAFF